jgi:hypothetical protein
LRVAVAVLQLGTQVQQPQAQVVAVVAVAAR